MGSQHGEEPTQFASTILWFPNNQNVSKRRDQKQRSGFPNKKGNNSRIFFLMLNTEIGKNKTFNPGLVTNKSESLSFSALFPCL